MCKVNNGRLSPSFPFPILSLSLFLFSLPFLYIITFALGNPKPLSFFSTPYTIITNFIFQQHLRDVHNTQNQTHLLEKKVCSTPKTTHLDRKNRRPVFDGEPGTITTTPSTPTTTRRATEASFLIKPKPRSGMIGLFRKSNLKFLQVRILHKNSTTNLIITISLLFSVSNLPISHNFNSGGYKYPQCLMNVKQQDYYFSNPSKTLMANNNLHGSLLVRESETLDLEDEPVPDLELALKLTLAGKLMAANRPSLSNMTFFASRTWDCPNRLTVFDHGRGLYSFQFVLEDDANRVVNGGPWFIDGKLLLIQRINPNLAITQLPFDSTKIWIRCYDLPPKAFNIKYAKAIGNMIGSYCDSDLHEEGTNCQLPTTSRVPSVRKFLRLKVLINIAIPLKRTQNIRITNSLANKVEEYIIRFAYECLPLFCYRCGLIGHEIEKCSQDGPTLYNDWIRAEKYYRLPVSNQDSTATQDFPQGQINQPQPQVAPTNDEPNPLILDPNIILANFSNYRDMGPLPPVPLAKETPLFGSLNTETISTLSALAAQFTRSGSPTAQASTGQETSSLASRAPGCTTQSLITAPTSNLQSSILGAAPLPQILPINTLSPLPPIDHPTSKGYGPSYYNPLVPSLDLFSPTTQRCLFKSELIHPALSSQTKAAPISPQNLSPIGPNPPTLMTPYEAKEKGPAADQVEVFAKGKGSSISRGKRPLNTTSSKAANSPKPKRGRPPSGSAKHA